MRGILRWVLGARCWVLGADRVRYASCFGARHGSTTLPRSRVLADRQRAEVGNLCIYWQARGGEGFQILRSDPGLRPLGAANNRGRIWAISASGFRQVS